MEAREVVLEVPEVRGTEVGMFVHFILVSHFATESLSIGDIVTIQT